MFDIGQTHLVLEAFGKATVMVEELIGEGEIRAMSDRLGLFLQLGWPWPSAD